MTDNWTIDRIPEQSGNLAIVTGGNSGIGFEAAKVLAGKGARVIIAARSMEKASASAAAIRTAHPGASVEVMALDLADLASVRRFAEAFLARHDLLPLLINNAGVMALPLRRTADGFEMQFGTNHLGHFALTGLLLPAILSTPGARVVTVSSALHRSGVIDFENLDGARGYDRQRAYSQSKLANLLFAYELHRRLVAAGASAISLGCHPGYASTNLQQTGPRMDGSAIGERIMGFANTIFAQSAEMGALPTLYAATSPDAYGCDYIGPKDFGGWRGYPAKARSSARSYDGATAQRLWDVSERLTGVSYDFAATMTPAR
ncbi:SDR family oxidoreductase [Chloroflexales bacterium ZM16-3]|nr:SDR family oxidoreductase [Chloroflexales bacterium ZM16-3]